VAKKKTISEQFARVFDALCNPDFENILLIDGTFRGEKCGIVVVEVDDEEGPDRIDDDLQVVAIIPKPKGKLLAEILTENGREEGPEDEDEDDESEDEEDGEAPRRASGKARWKP
jgi:hypothetical protein